MSQTSPASNVRRGDSPGSQTMKPAEDIVEYLKDYAKAKPDVAALWCFGLDLWSAGN